MNTKSRQACMIAAIGFAWLTVSCGDRQCTHTEYPQDFPTEARQQLASFGLVDGTEIVMCSLGQYRVGTVTVQNERALLVFEGDLPLYFSSSKGSDMFADGQSVATILPPPKDGASRILSYHGHDPTSGATVVVFDRDLDGQSDLRTRMHPDKSVETEVWFQGSWHALVHRGDERGVMVNGEFIPMHDILEIQQPGQTAKAQQ